MSLIEARNIKKYYNPNTELEVQALKNINLNIEAGDFCSILGASGSGKSTLLYILGCIDKCTEGILLLDGENISEMSEKKLAEIRNKRIGFVLQDFGLIEDETVIENVAVPTLFNPEMRRNLNLKVEEMLKKLEIYDLRNKKVNMLSGGQRQRVAIARALIGNPEIILADEPTGSLDSINSEHIMNIFEQLNREGKTIIIVTHNLEIARKTKKCFTIKDGLIYKA